MAITYDITPDNPFTDNEINRLVWTAIDESRAACKSWYNNRARVKALSELSEALEENIDREDLEYFLLTRKGSRSENWAYHLSQFFKNEELQQWCMDNRFKKLPQ